jgi:outer membrane protein
MRNFKLALFALLLLPASLMAQTGGRVGVVDFQGVAFSSDAGVAATTDIDAKAAELEAGLGIIQAQLAEAQTRYETQQRALSTAALLQLEAEITRINTQLTRGAEDAEAEIAALQGALLQPISDAVQQLVLDYAEEENFTLILDATAGIVFASEDADITSEIILRMNDKSAEAASSDASAAPGQ